MLQLVYRGDQPATGWLRKALRHRMLEPRKTSTASHPPALMHRFDASFAYRYGSVQGNISNRCWGRFAFTRWLSENAVPPS